MDEAVIPTEKDWRSEPWTLDSSYAYEHFFGKNMSEAFDLFVENALYYQEDIMFMPLACFQYYLHAYVDYLLSEHSKGDTDGASCFFGVVEGRHDDINVSAAQLRDRVREVLHRLRHNQQWYDAGPEIYGEFSIRADTALRLLRND